MNRFDRDLATLRDLIAARKTRGLRIEDLKTEQERRAYRMWRFLWAQYEMGIDTEDGEPESYEEVLGWVKRHDESPEFRAESKLKMYGPPMRHYLDKAEERLGYRPTPYEYYLEQEMAAQPDYDARS